MSIVIPFEKLHTRQAEIYSNTKADFFVIANGRRFGKTILAKTLLKRTAIKDAGIAFYIAPTMSMSTYLWLIICAELSSIITYKSAKDRIITLSTGGIIRFFTANNGGDSVRGLSADLVIIDECAMIPDLESVWTEAVSPTLADRNGKAYFLSTPKGAGHYFKKLFDMGNSSDPMFKKYFSYTFSTHENPYISKEFLVDIQRSISERAYRQEYLAEFIEDAGEVFKNVMACANVYQLEDSYESDFVFGIDFGRLNDYTIVTVFDVRNRMMVDFIRMTKMDFEFQAKRIFSLYEKWKPFSILAETTGIGIAGIDELIKLDLPVQSFNTTNKSKKDIIDRLALDFEKRNITIINDPQLVRELQVYEQTILQSGNIKFSAPSGEHDDMVMSLALANYHAHSFEGAFIGRLPKLKGWF